MEPIGQEISVNVKEVPELDGLKAGSKVCIKVYGTKLGQHTHVAGKKETMADVRIESLEWEPMEGEDESGE